MHAIRANKGVFALYTFVVGHTIWLFGNSCMRWVRELLKMMFYRMRIHRRMGAIMLDIVIQRMENVRADVDNKHVNSLKRTSCASINNGERY